MSDICYAAFRRQRYRITPYSCQGSPAGRSAERKSSALLSGILTKAGIYGVLILSAQLFFGDPVWGALLLGIGVLTMFGGALLAVCSIDLKRTLACSSMSQIGFILIGIGMQGLPVEGRELAVHGTLLHLVNHSMLKLVLFMAAGVLFMNPPAIRRNATQGSGRHQPPTTANC